ncbi:MAG: DUF5666 domain-containing protein [Pseudomonadota bacterium]
MYPLTNRTGIALATALLLTACGGGSGGDIVVNDPGPSQGIDRTGLRVLGTVNRFSSVVVDGTVFDTANATIEFDDDPVAEAALEIGQVVFVVGDRDANGNAAAMTIVGDDILRGPISAIDPAAETFVVLGQTVEVDVDTAFDDDIASNSIAGLAVDQNVAVSGFLLPGGGVAATRVEGDDGDDLQIVGVITAVDNAAMTLDIGSQSVDFAGAMLDDFDGQMPMIGDLVEIEATMLDGNGVLVATEIELEPDGIGGDDGDDIEIEGVITDVVSASEIRVNGLAVLIDAQTQFVGGTTADLIVGADVDVDAVVNADGVPLATEIEFEVDGEVRIEADVEAVDAAAGTLTTLGVVVTVPSDVRIEDDSDEDDRDFALADINVGDFVEVGAVETGANTATAELIKRDDDDNDGEAKLRARIDSIAEPDLTVLGVLVRTDGDTEFEGDDDQDLDAAAFFAAAAVGRLVSVDGTWDGNVLLAEEIELEDEE